MKRIVALLMASVMCAGLCGCGDDMPDGYEAFRNLQSYVTDRFDSEDYYLQLSHTKAGEQDITEVSKLGDDTVFLTYDAMGTITFFRNGRLINVNAENYYTPEEKDASWEDFSYGKTADKYFGALKELCTSDYDKQVETAFKDIIVEESGDEQFPYKVSVYCNLDNMNAKALFKSGGNFGSLSVKFHCDKDMENFDDVTLHTQYDYDSEIYVILAKFGEPDFPDNEGQNGQRPDDVEEVYKGYLEDTQRSYQEYLESIQESIAVNNSQ